MIEYFNEDIDFPEIDTQKVSNWITSVIKQYLKDEGDISYIFCSDNYLLQINKEYLQHDYFTDIITFNYNKEQLVSGDIFISLNTVKNNSIIYDVSLHKELLRVIIHGILHLIGFNDKTDAQQKEMSQKEDDALNIFPS